MKRITSMILAVAFITSATFITGQTGENLPTWKNYYQTGTAPVRGTNCIQTATLGATITGGTFRLTFAGATTTNITWVGENYGLLTRIQSALNALPTIGSGNCWVTAGTMTNGAGGTFLVTFIGNVGTSVQPVMTVSNNSLTGAAHTLTIAITTAGVEGDCRTCPKGSVAVALDTGIHYMDFGVPLSPIWVAMSTAATPTPTSTPTATATASATATSTSTPTATATPTTSP